MICPKCSYNHKKRDGTVCTSCGYVFAFNPATDGITDAKWAALMRKTSGNDTYHFTPNQLYAAWCRSIRVAPASSAALWGLVWLTAGVVVLLFGAFPLRLGYALCLFGVVLCGMALGRLGQTAPSREDFNLTLNRWRQGNTIELLIDRRRLDEPPPQWSETDIYDYGVERVLIVDDERLVDFLVLNDFHAEQRTVVIAETGYPTYIRPIVRKVLDETPDLPVYVLHDTSLDGLSLASRLPDLGFGVVSHPVYDLGWLSHEVEDINRLKRLQMKHWRGAVPIDLLHPKALLMGLTAAIKNGVPLAVPLGARQVAGDSYDGADTDIMILNLESDFG